jgi:putative membrane protein
MLEHWQLEPTIVCGLLLIGIVFGAGMRRRLRREGQRDAWRPLCFYSGLGTIYLALQSPLDDLSTHFFWIHQIQHLVLIQLAPVLLLLPAPQARLIAGLPRPVRPMVGAVLADGGVQATFKLLTHPATATVLFSLTLLVWNVPTIHDAAVSDGPLHDLMHVTMLCAGLIFWWRVLDHRAPPVGAPYIFRLIMLQIAMKVGVLLGGYLALKQQQLYTVYDRLDSTLPAATDEMLGGFILWFGGSVLPLWVGVVILRRWMRQLRKAEDGALDEVGIGDDLQARRDAVQATTMEAAPR